LQYLESKASGTHSGWTTLLTLFLSIDRSNTNFFEGEPLRPLSTLAYSDNVDLQRSAALAFAEITEKGKRMNELHDWLWIGWGGRIVYIPLLSLYLSQIDVRQVGRETLDPILFLLQSHDIEVQRAASAALGNLAVNSKCSLSPSVSWLLSCATTNNPLSLFLVAENKLLIVKLGGLEQLIRQMGSPNVEVQCNAVGCITNLATHGNLVHSTPFSMSLINSCSFLPLP
jgi:vacuolar protein 8